MSLPKRQLLNTQHIEPFFEKFFKHCKEDSLTDDDLRDFSEECLLLAAEALYGVDALKFIYENQKHHLI